MSSIDRLNAELAAIDNAQLEAKARAIVSAMCHGDRWRMSIPVQRDDSDILLSELLRRFRLYALGSQSEPELSLPVATGDDRQAELDPDLSDEAFAVLRREYEADASRGKAPEPTLMPCPFCGDTHIALHPNSLAAFGHEMGVPNVSVFYAHCDECGAEGPQEDSEPEAIAVWNYRASQSSPRAHAATAPSTHAPTFDETRRGITGVVLPLGSLVAIERLARDLVAFGFGWGKAPPSSVESLEWCEKSDVARRALMQHVAKLAAPAAEPTRPPEQETQYPSELLT